MPTCLLAQLGCPSGRLNHRTTNQQPAPRPVPPKPARILVLLDRDKSKIDEARRFCIHEVQVAGPPSSDYWLSQRHCLGHAAAISLRSDAATRTHRNSEGGSSGSPWISGGRRCVMFPNTSIVARAIVVGDQSENGTVMISVPPGRKQRKNSDESSGRALTRRMFQ